MGLANVLGYENVYEYLVREFFANMSVVQKSKEERIVNRTRVKGKLITISESRLCRWFIMNGGEVRPIYSNEEER